MKDSSDYEFRNMSRAWYVSYEKIMNSENNINKPDRQWIRNNYEFNIVANYPLVDEERPFMYAISNAFDGDPSTGFVEDTDDNKINISVNFKDNAIKYSKIKIINGYAKNKTLYMNNNRVKSITDRINKKSILLKDETLEFQIFNWNTYNLFVTELYTGSKYTDTCIAELNFMSTKNLWLFDTK